MTYGERDDRAQCSFTLCLSAGEKKIHPGGCARADEQKDKRYIST